jgi:hypothetical protein
MIDIAWGENEAVYADRGRRVPLAFRLNPLGAYGLGLSELYVAPVAPETKSKGGFTVLPDYTIVVPDSTDRPMPKNVVRALDDWEKQAGRIRLRQITILECDDAPCLKK